MAFAYSRQTEQNSDRIVYRAKTSWWIYLLPIVVIFFGFVMAGASGEDPFVGLLILFVGLFILIKDFIYCISTELYITQKFTIAKYGLIKRDTIEMLNSKVESIRVNQSILGRILNYGDVVVVGTGSSSSPVKFIANPLEFRRQLLYLQENKENVEGNHNANQ